MSKAASQIFQAVDGWGTNEDAIHSALKGKSPEEVAAIKAEYQNHYGKSLDSVLEDELSGDDLAMAKAAMTADPVQSAAASLVLATSGLGTDEAAVMDTLRGIKDPAVRKQVEAEYQKRTGQSIAQMIEDELGGADAGAATALAAGDADKADAIMLDDAMNGGFLGINKLNTDEDAINKVLEGRSPAEKDKLLAAYKAETKKDLADDLKANLDEGTEADLTGALLDGRAADAAAIRIQTAAEGWGTDEDAIFKQLTVADPAKRKQIIDAYNAKYGKDGKDLNAMLADELGDMDKERATQLAANGKLDPVFAMNYAMDGIGTDEDMMKDALANLTPAEAQKLQADYKAKYGKDLQSEMEGELSGRDEFYLKQSLQGEKGLSIDEKIKRANAAHDWERGSGAGVFSGFTDVFFDAGTQLDKDHERLKGLETQLAAASTPEAKAAVEAELNRALGYQTDSIDAYHAAQDSVANNAAMAGAVVATVAVTAATGGLGAGAAVPALASFMGSAAAATGIGATSLAMATGAVAGGLTSMAIKRSIAGEAYGAEAAGFDAAMTGVNALTAGMMASGAAVQGLPSLLASKGVGTFAPGVGSSFANEMATQLIQGAGQGLIGGIAQGALDEKTWRGPGNGALNFLGAVGSNMVSNMAGSAVQVGAGKISPFDGDTLTGSFMHGAVGGAGGAAGQTLMTAGTFDGRWEDTALKFGSSMGTGAIQGGLMNVGQKVSADALLAEQTAKQNAPVDNPAKDIPDDVVKGLPEEVQTVVKDAKDNPPQIAADTKPADVSALGPEVKAEVDATQKAVEVAKDAGNGGNNNGGGGGGGNEGSHPPPSSDQAQRDALVELAIKDAKTPEDRATIAQWAKELDAANPTPMREALADLQGDVHPGNAQEGAAIKKWERESATLPGSEAHFDFDKAAADNKAAGARDNEIKQLKKTDPDAAALLAPKEANPELSTDIKGLMQGADAARVSEDPKLAALQSQRAQFETAVAMSPEAQAAVKPMLDEVAGKALDYLTKMHGDGNGGVDPKVMAKLGIDPSQRNYAGAVGTDPATLLEVMKSGNVRERMVALSEFQEKILGVDALAATADTPDGQAARKKMEALFGEGKSGFSKADLDRLLDRTETYRENTKPEKLDAKGVFNPMGDEHQAYWDAKRQDMDTKLPAFTAEAMKDQMGIDTGGKSTKIGEGNILARAGISIDEAQAMGLNLSPAEIAQAKAAQQNPKAGIAEGELPWVMGSKANMVDPDAPFIQGAKDNAMPLKAGISGTTARGMGLFDVMGVNQTNPELARLALMAQLQPIEAHSYHEIASAANGYMTGEAGSQFRYDVTNPYSNMGLPEDLLREIALRNGLSLDDLNRTPNR